ncbi:hypothetical protein EKO23_13865 [Nocardioides guangzhouensis]|uniref:Uncharacterized protein n=1 Tax=Nocardioides guangzhouensis TaxID=2497878 RepID=A0A4Q4ZAV1_9ACTN|nr:hypothetical protein [Nocardioides guangzhouensis]RYP85067.1 hypothetical protein EKO23_13865 [Nocardioides guangzhouensis]
MDLSGMIFVALAVAWAVYLIPKALRHHDEVARSRSVDRFSNTMRVLARREPVNKRDVRLVVTPGRAAAAAEVTVKPSAAAPTPAQLRARREAAKRATKRRRRVLGLLLLANVVVSTLAALEVVAWVWEAIPAGLVVVWLVLCRVMVKSERRGLAPVSAVATADAPVDAPVDEEVPAEYAVERNRQGFDEVAASAETATMPAVADGTLWDPLPVTLPTYVTKPAAARRTVRTIELGEPGAWTSGRTEESAAMAREADAAAASARDVGDEPERRAVGS